MKKRLKKLNVVLPLILFALLGLVACSSDDDANDDGTEEGTEGKPQTNLNLKGYNKNFEEEENWARSLILEVVGMSAVDFLNIKGYI